jgi:L-asparaginase II
LQQTDNPILVEVTRGPAVESIHRGAAIVIDNAGGTVASWGNVTHPVYPRSAVKPLQAVPLIVSGAADALDVSPEEIALACASHSGEPAHTSAVDRWLHRLGYDVDTLECGAHPPVDNETSRRLMRQAEEPTQLHNNCSGKHAGFLTICRHLGFPAAGYTRPDHPVQHLIRKALEALTGCSLQNAPLGVDGCGIPVYGMPLQGIATAMMKIACPDGLDDETARAVVRIREAMIAHPHLVAGRHRFCTEVMNALAPNVVVKTGAEGVFCAAMLDQGLGVALKIDDGASRASEVAMGGVLRRLEAVGTSQFRKLAAKLEPEVRNVAGKPVGVIRASSVLLVKPQVADAGQ